MNKTISPVYLRADTINGVQYCDQSDINPSQEYLEWFFVDCLHDLKDGEEIFTTVTSQQALDAIIELFGIN